MEILTKLRKVGGSLMARIQKEVLEEESLRPGEIIRLEVKKVKKSAFGIAKGIKSFTHEERQKMWEDKYR